MRPFFSYYGGKWRMTPKYPKPQTGHIVEPFAGSAGYSVRHNADRVTLCDSSPVIAGVWSYLVGASRQEILSLPDVEAGQTVDDLDSPQEARWLIGFWLNKGAASPCKKPSAWMRKPEYARQFWGESARERISSQVDQIRHWDIVCGDYRDLPDVGADWFIDPPYRGAGKHYPHGDKGIDFGHLGDWCRARQGQAIVCEAAGADWLPFEDFGSHKSTRSGKPSKESIWTGGSHTSPPAEMVKETQTIAASDSRATEAACD